MRETKADRIKREIAELDAELRKHQTRCKHKKATYTYGANQGNYDPSCDCYWIDFSCSLCHKRWTVYDRDETEWLAARQLTRSLTEVKKVERM